MTNDEQLRKAVLATLIEKRDYTTVLELLDSDNEGGFGDDTAQLRDLIMQRFAEVKDYKSIASHLSKRGKKTKEQKALQQVVKPLTDLAQLFVGNTKGDFMKDLLTEMEGKVSEKGQELLQQLTDIISSFRLETKAVLDDASIQNLAKLAQIEATLKASLMELATQVVASKAAELLPGLSKQAKLTKAEINEIIYQTALSVESQISNTLGEYIRETKLTADQISDFQEAVLRFIPPTAPVRWEQIQGKPDISQGGTSVVLVRRLITNALAIFNGGTTGQVLTKLSDDDGDFAWQDPTGGGGGGSVTVATPTGTVDATNVTFTVPTIPKWIVSDGITTFEGAGYSRTGLSITMEVPPSQYIRSIS